MTQILRIFPYLTLIKTIRQWKQAKKKTDKKAHSFARIKVALQISNNIIETPE